MDGPTDRLTDWTDRWMNWMDGQTDIPTSRRMDRPTDRWMHGMERHGTDKRTDDGLID